MFAKSVFLLALASTTFAAPQIDFLEIAKSFTAEYGTARATGTAGAEISSQLSQAKSIISEFSAMPTLPSSVYSRLATLVDADDESALCAPTAASWYSSLDRNAQAAITSYASAIQTWAASRQDDEDSLFGGMPICSGVTASTTPTTTRVVGGFTSAKSSSSTLPAVTSTSAPAAAPQVTGAIMGSIAGVMGVIGAVAAL